MAISMIHRSLREHGLVVEESWVEDAYSALYSQNGDVDMLREIYLQYIHCDLRLAAPHGSGRLAKDVHSWKEGVVSGLLCVQIECVESIAEESVRKDSRSCKVLVTDGCLEIAGFEVSPVDDLAEAGLGTKLLLRDVPVRRGLLLLEPSNTRVLGGCYKAEGSTTQSKEDAPSEREQTVQPPPAKRIRPSFVPLSDFANQSPPITVTAWGFVDKLKKFYWSSHQNRYLLVISLRDTKTAIDCVLSEQEFTHLFGKSSTEFRQLPEAHRNALSSQVTQNLRNYEGAIQIQKKYRKDAFAHLHGRKHDALPLILSCTQLAQDDKSRLRELMMHSDPASASGPR